MQEEQTQQLPPEQPITIPEPETPVQTESPASDSKFKRFRAWYGGHKLWTIPVTVLLLLLVLAVAPFTRYAMAGMVIKKDLQVKLLDSTTNTPVSGASVSIGSTSAQTDNDGKATLHHLGVGHHNVVFSKKYYQDKTVDMIVPILGQKGESTVQLSATGRQAKITITNVINKSPLENVTIKVAGITAKTDSKGSTTVVLPVDATEQKASLTAKGFNDTQVSIKVSNDKIADNQFTMTPSGKVYFLSKLSGKIDVVKTNLDGTTRETVLAGTGKEDSRNTVLLASRDWKYLALLSRRAGGSYPSIYLINTSDDTLSTIDHGAVDFQLLGWSGDYFAYQVNRDYKTWQPRAQSIKSYNAQTKKLEEIATTSATGSNEDNAQYEVMGQPILLEDEVLYDKNWYQGGYDSVVGKNNTLNVVKPDGSGKEIVKSLVSHKQSFGVLTFHAPYSVYVQVTGQDEGNDEYYEFNGTALTKSSSISFDDIYEEYPTYLYSPNAEQTFWSEERDGKNTLFVGDDDGKDGKNIAALSEYNTYGWYTDKYLLVSKNSSELYIMPVAGSDHPIKVSDYHKPVQNFNGYGGGYGGL